MGAEELEKLIAAGREQYSRLQEEATDLLRNLDTLSPRALGEAVQRRQNLVEKLQQFDARFDEAYPGPDYALAEFRRFQEKITKKILEIDALVIALAQGKQAALKGKLASISKSHAAFRAYEKRGPAQRRPWLNDSV